MKRFTFSVPQNILFGEGVLKELPGAAGKLGGKHGFIISGPTLNRLGVVGQCEEILTQAGIAVNTFCDTEGNPSVETVERAAEAFWESGADFIVALGGGSPMDVAKAVGVVAKYGGSITGFILSVLVQWEKCNIFPVLYRKDSKDCTFYFCVIIHGKGDGVMCLVYFTFTVGCTGSTVTWYTSALIKFVAHNKSSVLILPFKDDSIHDIKDILTDKIGNSN